ncbi:K+-transporting ATPase ATPase C chain [Sporomusaceae bacterium BoRhaA]|uniref:potassium-transporting ATPase subunit KdpC n=1 Tax=Pelorhabdus rhamnosifermentans TaxID=2772457 RepID=UPI001C05F7C7|nr:potassium-transporting ATPase subunit KdpC [Pelorhabdus rhamnosifermentans]MBU2703750.1 K+-transporting ATPase ATPase C chain [Pelorhabdus rhamnosifermentans]
MIKQGINGLLLLVVLTALTGFAYPLAMTGLAQAFFPQQARGSFVEQDGKIIGSMLIGQNFSQPGYFQGRPSAAGDDGYDAASSSGTNLGPTSAKLMDAIQGKAIEVRSRNHLADDAVVPADLVTSSASGLDPDISPEGAYLQINRVAEARNLSVDQVRKLVDSEIRYPQFGILGQARVNVLRLNLLLEDIAQ